MVVDDSGHLAGIFTDSDLARLLECKRDDALDRPIEEVMTHGPQTVRRGEWLSEAIQALAARKISELPVVDDVGVPLGLIDITDVVAVVPSNRGPLRESAEPTRDEDGIPAIISFPSREGA